MTRWTEKDLDLFKSRRQRGTSPPPALEFELQCLIADVLRRWGSREWKWTHIPLGELRSKATAGRLQRMGVTSGWPDFVFFHYQGQVCFLELKRRGRKATQVQEAMGDFLQAAGHHYLLTDNFETALNFLKARGIVLSKITTIGKTSGDQTCLTEERPIEER